MIKGILFDKDGTLLDYFASWMPVNRAAALAAAGGEPVLAERLLVAAGYEPGSGRVLPGSLLAAGTSYELACFWAGLVERRSEALFPEIERIFVEEGREQAVPVPRLAAVIAGLKGKGYRLGLATSDSEAGAYASLSAFEVLQNFDFVAGFDSGYGVKPGPGMVLAFCARTGLEPRAVAVVGDNLHDLEMGRSAGAGLLVGVLTGTSLRQDLIGHAHHVIDSIADLELLLQQQEALA